MMSGVATLASDSADVPGVDQPKFDHAAVLKRWAGRRVCVLLAKDRPGGLVGYVGDLVETLREHGIRTRLVAVPSAGLDVLRERLGEADLVEARLGVFPGIVRREASASDAVLVHTAKFPPDTRFAWRLLGLRTPIIELLHGLPRRERVRWTRRLVYRVRGTRRYRLGVLNEEMQRVAERNLPALAAWCAVVRSGTQLPTRRSDEPSNDTPIVVSLTRLDETSKDCGTLIRAAASLRRRGVPVQVRLIGDGPDRGELESLDRSLDAAVAFVGWCDDPARELRAADVFVLSTRGESFGRATAEASAVGLPVVASDVMGCRDVVRDGETGLLVPPGDAEAMADAVEMLLHDRLKRERFGRAGALHVQRFSIDRHAAALLGLADGIRNG